MNFKPNVVVIGAGVIGLTTATLLQAAGLRVILLADQFPDIYSEDATDYASPKAGAHWRSVAESNDTSLQELDGISLRILKLLLQLPEAGVMKMPSFDMMTTHESETPWFARLVDDFQWLPPKDLCKDAKSGFKYTTYSINTPKYLSWLLRLFKRLGGKIQKKKVQHISEAKLDGNIQLIVNCTGLGSKTLGGVQDSNLYPTRGQIVLVQAPQVKYTITRLGPNWIDYVIPREDGLVVLGGTQETHATSMQPDPDTAERILERTIEICPQLSRWPGDRPKIIAHRVGLRPSRKGGVRIALETTEWGPLIHNYGHGGYGYQSSWGSAQQAYKLYLSYLRQMSPSNQPREKKGLDTFENAIKRILAVGNIRSRI